MSGPSISWKAYDAEYGLSAVLTDAARACVNAKAAKPSEFLLSYFAKLTRGDSVEALTCGAICCPPGCPHSGPDAADTAAEGGRAPAGALTLTVEAGAGLRVAVQLFTHARGEVEVTRLTFRPRALTAALDGEGAAGAVPPPPSGVALTDTLVAFARDQLTERLRGVGVLSTSAWDETLSTASFLVDAAPAQYAVPLPASALLAFSLSAWLAGARHVQLPLYRHLHRAARPPSMRDDSSRPLFTLPRLLLPFLGAAAEAGAPPAGCVRLHTLYLIPCANADAEAADEPPADALPPSRLRALVGAFEELRHRRGGAPVRADGAVAVEDFENITDALQLATEVLESVGIVAGRDVVFGLRVLPSVVTLPSPSVAPVAAPASAPSAPHGAGEKKTAGTSGSKAAAPVPSASECVYAVFAGDPDVTGSQLAEYVRQQVVESAGRLAYVQDTHHPADRAGLARLRSGLRGTGCVMAASNAAADSEAVVSVLDVLQAGTLTQLAARCAGSAAVALVAHPEELRPLSATVDMAVALGCGYVCVGGLGSTSACSALSQLSELRRTLDTEHSLRGVAPLPVDDAAGPSATETAMEPVPEIKRRSDKKRRKGK